MFLLIVKIHYLNLDLDYHIKISVYQGNQPDQKRDRVFGWRKYIKRSWRVIAMPLGSKKCVQSRI